MRWEPGGDQLLASWASAAAAASARLVLPAVMGSCMSCTMRQDKRHSIVHTRRLGGCRCGRPLPFPCMSAHSMANSLVMCGTLQPHGGQEGGAQGSRSKVPAASRLSRARTCPAGRQAHRLGGHRLPGWSTHTQSTHRSHLCAWGVSAIGLAAVGAGLGRRRLLLRGPGRLHRWCSIVLPRLGWVVHAGGAGGGCSIGLVAPLRGCWWCWGPCTGLSLSQCLGEAASVGLLGHCRCDATGLHAKDEGEGGCCSGAPSGGA